jgi:protoheme IX farnesyltransferase
MDTTTAAGEAAFPLSSYAELTKPKAILPHFITAAAAMVLAAGGAPPVSTLVFTLLGGGCVAAAANTMNSVLDRDIDALMARTSRRPLPSGRVTPGQALVFGVVMGVAGVALLAALVNCVAAMLALVALAYYVLPYTAWLKRRTYWSAIVGSAIGAIPPLIGWAAVTYRLEATPFLLSAIIGFWTLPHFWALVVFRRDDYARAGLRMLPDRGVAAYVIACCLLLVATSLLLAPVARLGLLYMVTACLSGAGMIWLTLRMGGVEAPRRAQRLYTYSVLYIGVLFVAMIFDRLSGSL